VLNVAAANWAAAAAAELLPAMATPGLQLVLLPLLLLLLPIANPKIGPVEKVDARS
jgi:hypothetical protein